MLKKLLLVGALILGFIACGESADIRVMTFNTRYDNPGDGVYVWSNRCDSAVATVKSWDCDIIGMQEVLTNQNDYYKKHLLGYEAVGVGRIDGDKVGEFCTLFIRSSRFGIDDSGYFWVSETPEVVGHCGWDGACERIATWVKLTDKKSGKKIFVLNTHLDHVGELARAEGIKLIVSKSKELSGGKPIIVMGDFNMTPDSKEVQYLLNEGTLSHTRDHAAVVSGPKWTFTSFNLIPDDEKSFIDYIFTSKGLKVKSHTVLEHTEDFYISDHIPVVSDLTIE